MSKKERLNFSRRVSSRLKGGIARTPLLKEYYKNLKIIVSNNLTRLLFLVLDFVLIVFLLYLLSISFNPAANIIGQLMFLLFSLIVLYIPATYFWRSALQFTFETSLNSSIYDVRKETEKLRMPKPNRNYRSLQGKISRVRQNLKNFVEYSEILSPPIFNYELDRLQKRIDIFFNCASEILVPVNKLFSRAEEFEEEAAESQYHSWISPEEESDRMEEARMRDVTGEIIDFDLRAMDEFMGYLCIGLFEKETKRYSPFSFKHPVNLIVLSRFFDRWNSVISSCSNCRTVFEKASKDIEDYYKQLGRIESKRRQQIWQLKDQVLIVILSVGISTLVQYLMKITSNG